MAPPMKKPGAGRSPEFDRRNLCEEAARIMVEHGITDYRFAKQKAVARLGLSPRRTELPSNRELAEAMRVRLRLFDHDGASERYRTRLDRAVEIMQRLNDFRPRLVGSLLNGIATEHGAVELHLFSDVPESVMACLQDLRLAHRSFDKRVRFPRDQHEHVPGFSFEWRNSAFDVLVFQSHRIRQAPLCPVEGRPMQRAPMKRVRQLKQACDAAPPGAALSGPGG